MKVKIEKLIAELKTAASESKYSIHSKEDPEAKINIWYVIAKLEEALREAK